MKGVAFNMLSGLDRARRGDKSNAIDNSSLVGEWVFSLSGNFFPIHPQVTM